MGVMILSSILYYFLQQPFTIFSHWFSNLGVGPTGWSFNQGLQGTAILYSAMVIFFSARFNHGKPLTRYLMRIGAIFGTIAVVGIFILTTNNMIDGHVTHAVGAYMYFISTPIFCSFVTAALESEGGASKRQWLFTLWLVFASIAMVPLMSIIGNLIGLAPDQILGSMDPRLGPARMFEWIAVFSFFIWIFQTGLQYKQYTQKKQILQA
jgi:hypothetical protein